MAPWIDEEHPEGMVVGTETALNQQEGQIEGQKAAVRATQRITQANPSLSRVDPALALRPYGVDV
jgi:hypothetical protein